MKRLLLTLALLLIVTGCSTTQVKHLDAKDFIRQSDEINKLNSAYNTCYIGDTPTRIYLEYYSAITSTGKGKTIIYWTEKKNLSRDQIQKLKDNKISSTDG